MLRYVQIELERDDLKATLCKRDEAHLVVDKRLAAAEARLERQRDDFNARVEQLKRDKSELRSQVTPTMGRDMSVSRHCVYVCV